MRASSFNGSTLVFVELPRWQTYTLHWPCQTLPLRPGQNTITTRLQFFCTLLFLCTRGQQFFCTRLFLLMLHIWCEHMRASTMPSLRALIFSVDICILACVCVWGHLHPLCAIGFGSIGSGKVGSHLLKMLPNRQGEVVGVVRLVKARLPRVHSHAY